MKKTLLLSIVASTMIMAGGDIAPVEPAVSVPAPVAVSNWKFSGQGVVYYQTDDAGISGAGIGDLFDQAASSADAGLQLTATNSDVFAGIGFGAQLDGLATLGLEHYLVSNIMQSDAGNLTGGWISQLYLTYGMGNTSLKAGRQELPKSLSPFAYSENWNVFANTFDGVLLVNTDLPDTVLVGAWVDRANRNGMAADMSYFSDLNHDNGVWMLTAQNKSIADLTLTGSWYYGNDFVATPGNDLNILWGDLQYNAGMANIGIQGGAVMDDALTDDTNAVGAMISGKLDVVNVSLAYDHVNASDLGMFQVGSLHGLTGSTSVLYTDTALNQVFPANLSKDMDKFVVTAGADVLGGNLTGVYAYENGGPVLYNDFNEFDLVYSTTLLDNLSAAVAYVYSDVVAGDANLVRVVARYNF
ncbi:MAG: hypothetical protein PHE73_06265 [Sulfurovaceae bacterium]|nr:hypothetical protein [Sulfurovaceae bacterium]